MMLAENSIWSSKGGERRPESKSPKGNGTYLFFYLGNGYPVKTDAFMPSLFSGREKAARAAGQWHVQAGPMGHPLLQPAVMCLCLMLPFPKYRQVEQLQPKGAGHGMGTPREKV